MANFNLKFLKQPIPAWVVPLAMSATIPAIYFIGLPNSNQRPTEHAPSVLLSPTAMIWTLIAFGALAVVVAVTMFAPRLPAMPWAGSNGDKAVRRQSDHLSQTGALLNLELGRVLAILRARIGTDESYAASLSQAQARLSELATPEQVRVIVSLLVAENHRMRLDSTNMTKQLDASRKQIEALRSKLEKAYEVGLQDPLTSIGNRRCFDLALTQAVGAANQNKWPLSIVLGDLDSFKKINDDFGHQVGDEVLKFFSQLMVGNVREGDTVARFGGEEFALILPQCSLNDANAIADRIRTKLSAKALTIRRTSQEIGVVTASFGVAQLKIGEKTENLLNRADSNLYEAKRRGRNLVLAT